MPLSLDSRYEIAPLSAFDVEIRSIFRDTFFLGDSLDVNIIHFDLYEDMCLSWYLQYARQESAVVVDVASGKVVGYVLVCTTPSMYQRWMSIHARRLFMRAFLSFASGRMSQTDIKFFWYRAMDSLTVIRSRKRATSTIDPHIHMNLRSEARSGMVALSLLLHVDKVCSDAGFASWVGEINANEGSREKAIRRLVGEIEDVSVNRTASYFLKSRVVRLTVRRKCGEN